MIQVLDAETVRQIAAGEVVERPASALRELLDNALDAGAKDIRVVLEDGGKTLLSVSDDGEGMDQADLLKAPLLHATSKINHIHDLNTLHTFGFRGEALASLAGVSRLSLSSRREGAEHGWEYVLEFGKIFPLEPKGMNRGTTVAVERLFEGLPARLKFLGTDAGEQRACSAEFVKKALAYPQCAFRMSGKNGEIFNLPPAEELYRRVHALFPDAPLQGFFYEEGGISAAGFCSPPNWYRPTRSHQFLFINKRPIEWAPLRGQIAAAYGNLLPPGKFPACFIYLEIPPETVDFNVHPQKREIRFQDEGAVAALVRRALRKGLLFTPAAPVSAPPPPASSLYRPKAPTYSYEPPFRDEKILPASPKVYRLENEPALFARGESLADILLQARFAGHLFRTYLVYDTGAEAVFVDFHALHERIRYERIKGQKSLGMKAQPLLTPMVFTFPQEDADKLERMIPAFEALGFSLNRIGGARFSADALPSVLEPARAEEVLADLLQLAGGGLLDFSDSGLWDRACKSIACKGSVKSGDNIGRVEAESLLQLWKELGAPPSCPHGRPIAVRKSRSEFDKEFKRLGF